MEPTRDWQKKLVDAVQQPSTAVATARVPPRWWDAALQQPAAPAALATAMLTLLLLLAFRPRLAVNDDAPEETNWLNVLGISAAGGVVVYFAPKLSELLF